MTEASNPQLRPRRSTPLPINVLVLGFTKKEPERRGCAEEGCRRQARRALRVVRNANQIDAKTIDFAEDSFKLADAGSPLQAK